MDRPIQVGDLVQVVRWPHPCTHGAVSGKTFPWIFRVKRIRAISPKCPNCNQQIEPGSSSAYYSIDNAIPLPWLKRIPPLSELEGTKTDEPMKEPA